MHALTPAATDVTESTEAAGAVAPGATGVTGATEARWGERQRRFFVWVPYSLLAICTVGLLLSGQSQVSTPTLVGLVAGLATWEAAWWTHGSIRRPARDATAHPARPAQDGRPQAQASPTRSMAYLAGVLVLGAGLVHAHGIYAFVIWPYIIRVFELFDGARRWPALFATSAIISWGQIGSPLHVSLGTVGAGLGLLLMNGGIAAAMMKFAEVTESHDLQRRQALTDLEATNLELEAALAQVTGLQSQLVTQAREAGIAAERERFAGEVHDTIAQGLAGVVTQLEAFDAAATEADRRHHLGQAKQIARRALGEARRSLRAVGPEPLEQARLPAAIREVVDAWSAETGVATSVEVTGVARQLVADVDIAIYRATQEALVNVAKHAGASRAVVTLSYTDDEIRLEVRDDGRGLPRTEARFATDAPDGTGFGLRSMRQRVAACAGSVTLQSEPAEGTTVILRIPVGAGRDDGVVEVGR